MPGKGACYSDNVPIGQMRAKKLIDSYLIKVVKYTTHFL